MVKKAILLFTAAACFSGGAVKAQQPHCFADEMHARVKAKYPKELAAAEAAMKAHIDAALGKMNFPKMKVTAEGAFDDHEVLRVPVVFHVIHNYGAEYIPDSVIYDELEKINTLYRGANSDTSSVIAPYKGNIPGTNIKYIANTNIQFYLARKDPFGNPTTGITRRRDYSTGSGGDHAKFDLWPPQNYLNVWIVNAFDASHSQAAAYAYKPATASILPWFDGPITTVGSGRPLNNDNTLAHEIGHHFDLDHPWGGTNNPQVACGDDGVEDTPPTEGHYNPIGCVPVNLYDTKCVLTSTLVGKATINNNNKVADAQTGVGIQFKTLEKVQIDAVDIYPAVNGVPFTIQLKRKDGTVIATQNGVTNTTAAKQTVQLTRFVAPVDTQTNAYSLEFSVNPSVYRDSTSALAIPNSTGNAGTVGNVIYFTDDTAQGRYNYFYNWSIRYGDYYVEYPASMAYNLFGINAPLRVDYPDTVNSQNVMDYTYCSKMFTYLQSVRMRAALRSTVAGRSTLIDTANLIFTGLMNPDGTLASRPDLPPKAEFSTSVGNVQNVGFTCRGTTPVSQNVVFTNRSWRDTVTKISWEFSHGATNPTPVVNNPRMNLTNVTTKFNDTGWVTVKMIAESNAGRDTLITSNRVYVADETALPASGYIQEFNGADDNMYPTFNYFDNFTKWEIVNNAGYYDNTSMRYNQFDSRSGTQTFNGTPRGDYDDFYTRAFDLTNIGGTIYLNFYTSGAFRTNNPTYMQDLLEISYSANCGLDWSPLKTLSKTDIGNNGPISNTPWVPGGMWDWKSHSIAISTTALAENARGRVFFRFRFKPGVDQNLMGSGNNFYIDRISINPWTTEVNEIAEKEAGIALAPNPTTGSTTVVIKDAKSNTAQIAVTDVTGKLVYGTTASLMSGITRVEIPAGYIAVKGMYMVTVTTGNHKQTEKLVVY